MNKSDYIKHFAIEVTRDLGGAGSGNHGHKGRPGQVGGSDDDGSPNASAGGFRQRSQSMRDQIEKEKRAEEKAKITPKKMANALAKAFKMKFTSDASFGGSKDSLRGHTSVKNEAKVIKAIEGLGFEKFDHPNRQDWVKSYYKDNVAIDISVSDTLGGKMLRVSTYPYDPEWKVPIHLPQD